MENLSKKTGYIIVITFWLIILSLISSCGITAYHIDPIYEDHPHTTEVYWHNEYDIGGSPYFGYWGDFWYYYGVPHYYPWWYYYQFIPPTYYYAQWHVHVQCDEGNYVYGHRGPTFNNQVQKDFIPTIKVKNNKDKSFVFPRDWKSSNSTRLNKQNNVNNIDYNRIFNINPQTNIRPINNNRNNNKSNNKSNNRSNKLNKPRK